MVGTHLIRLHCFVGLLHNTWSLDDYLKAAGLGVGLPDRLSWWSGEKLTCCKRYSGAWWRVLTRHGINLKVKGVEKDDRCTVGSRTNEGVN